MKRETIARLLKLVREGKRRGNQLDGCPFGSWGETVQARRELGDELPRATERAYTLEQAIEALYTRDHADRYRFRF